MSANVEESRGLLSPDDNGIERQETRDSTLLETAATRNVLGGIPANTLMQDVQRFAEKYNLLDELDALKKGALVAQGETQFREIPDITKEEVRALDSETSHKWSQPFALYFTIVVCSLGAMTQGWAQTGANGANLQMPSEFGIGSDSQHDTLIVGLLNSAPYMCVAFVSSWAAAPLNTYLGRRMTIFIGGLTVLTASLLSAVTQDWAQLLAARFLLGFGLGVNATTISVYAAECAPASIRGGLAVSWQMFTALGIFLGFVANVVLVNWRLQLGSSFVPPLPLICGVVWCPESPVWCMKSPSRYRDAFQALSRLRNSKIQAARDLYYSHVQQESKRKEDSGESFFTKVVDLFTIPRNRRATQAATVVMIAQQLSGVNLLAFYSSTVFVEGGLSERTALLGSCVFGLLMFLFAWPAVYAMDSFGRRSLLLATFPHLAWTMLAAGLCFLIPVDNSLHIILISLFFALFTIVYSPGAGPVPFTYCAEVFPSSHREQGMSYSLSTISIFATLLSLTFPGLLAALGATGAFALYAGLNVVALILIFLFLPETKQKTLDELDQVFSIPTSVFVRQEMSMLRLYFRKYVLQEPGVSLDEHAYQPVNDVES